MLPFATGTFDVTVCRQGVQFCNAAAAVTEFVRVTREGGRVLIANLCAYGEGDREEFFEVMRLRNPARQQFFVRDDLRALLRTAGCTDIRVVDFVSAEDVDAWADNHAIPVERRQELRQRYETASPSFTRLHRPERIDGRIIDHMLFELAVGTVRRGTAAALPVRLP
jgi:SAM-dependent methyltransferase